MSYNSLYNNQVFIGDEIDVGTVETDTITLRSTADQLTLNNTTINDQSTVVRTITIPNTISTSADFVLTDDSGQVIGGDNTFTGINSFSAGIKVDNISEYTTDNGVTIDGIKIKDGLFADTAYGSGILRSDASGVITAGSNIVNNDVASNAGIVYSKLNLANSITNADIISNAGIVFSKLNLANGITNNDINSAAAIAYSKLNLSNSIQGSDIYPYANIPYSALYLVGGIMNNDINYNAGIAYSKLNLANAITNNDIVNNAGIPKSKLNLTGTITNNDLSSSANISDDKLLTIQTAGKVSNYATSATSSNVADSIVLRSGVGGFSCGYITSSSTVTATLFDGPILITGHSPATSTEYRLLYTTTSATQGNPYRSNSFICGLDGANNSYITVSKLNGTSSAANAIYIDTAPSSTYSLAIAGGTGSSQNIYAATALNYNVSSGHLSCPFVDSIVASTQQVDISNGTSSVNYVCFSQSQTGVSTIRTSTNMTYDATTKTLTVDNLAGNASTSTSSTTSGTATYSNYLNLSAGTAVLNYLTFAESGTGYQAIKTDVDLYYNASTNTLTCSNFNGTVSSCTNATNIGITDTTAAATYYPIFSAASTGNQPARTHSANLKYYPASNSLECANFTGTASKASDIYIENTPTTNSTFYPLFAGALDTYATAKCDNSSFTYNPSTNTLTVANLAGNASTATDSTNSANIAITDTTASASTHYPLFASATSGNTGAKTDSTGLTYVPSTNTLSASVFSGALSGNATSATDSTNSANIAITDTTSSASTHYLLFASATSGNTGAKTDSTGLTYVPSTNTISTTTFSGDHTGTINSATTATTQTAADNSTKISTTAYADRAVSNVFTTLPILLSQATGYITSGIGAATYSFCAEGPVKPATGSTAAPVLFYLNSADYPSLPGKTAKLKISCVLTVNGATPFTGSNTAIISMNAVSYINGNPGANYTFGSAVTGSTITYTAPAAGAIDPESTAAFSMPANNTYGLLLTTSQNCSSTVNFSVRLFLIYT